MKRFGRLLAFTAVMTVALVICMGAKGCRGTAVHQSSLAAASIGASLQTAATTNHQLIQAGEESAQEGALVASYIDQAAKANDAFTKTVQSLPNSGSQLTSAQAITAFNTLLAQISTLQSQGVLHLKSTKAQTAFATIMTSIQAQIAIVQAVIAANSSSMPRHGPNPFIPAAPLLGLALTAEEIEELIALAIAAGSALVTKLESLRGESDPQLQASALASDAAAEQQAEADEQPAS
jgi:hypothetical protein